MKKTIALLLCVLMALSFVACGQKKEEAEKKVDYPVKNIEMVVPFSAGGSTDINARLLAKAAEKKLPEGINIVVNNVPGGSSTIGTAEVVDAPADGYKILMTSTAPLTIAPHQGNAAYKYNDVTPVIKVSQTPQILVVRADSQWHNYDEWMEWVKANPGKFTYGVAGIGTTSHLVMENLNVEAGIETTVVPFKSSNESQAAVLGGNVDGFVVSFLAPNEELRPLFSFGMESPMYDIPTLKSKGFSEINMTYGIFVPKGTPAEVVQYLHDAFKAALDDPEVIAGYESSGVVANYADGETFAKEIETENAAFGETMKKIGLAK